MGFIIITLAQKYVETSASMMSTGWWPEAIHEVRVPVKNEKAPHGMCFQKFPILHPHEILSYLWDEVGIVVPESEIAKYWHTAWQRGEPWATSSPASDKHIPVGLHGDSARLWSQNKFEKITAIHLNIVHFRPCSVRFSRWCLFSCPTHLLFKNRTLNVVWKRLTWSLESAFEGLHPMTGVGGKPLSQHEQSCAGQPLSRSGAKWALTELRGDWEFHVQTWRPRASWQANRVCFRCPALAKSSQPSYLYWNHHGEECGWESEEYGLAGFMAQALKDTNLCTLANYKLSSFCCLVFAMFQLGYPWGLLVIMFLEGHCQQWGPLLTLSMFRHPSILRWCTMHTLNIGLVFSANGGSLNLCWFLQSFALCVWKYDCQTQNRIFGILFWLVSSAMLNIRIHFTGRC